MIKNSILMREQSFKKDKNEKNDGYDGWGFFE
jgi:hypothetical protein